jgi:hypothetical protein
VPEVKRTPARSASGSGDLYALMPGDLITISNGESAAASGGDATICNSDSSGCSALAASASFGLQNKVTLLSGSRQRNADNAARPSRP